MKKISTLPLNSDGSIDINTWLEQLPLHKEPHNLLRESVLFSRNTEDHLSFYGKSCFAQALEIARLVAELKLDQDAIAASIAYVSVEYGDLKIEDVEEQLGSDISKLVAGIQKMSALAQLQSTNEDKHIDSLRRMLLAMVSDVRVVVIKLAERLCIMRLIKNFNEKMQTRLAEETMHIYAPLANRLGIHQLKWELEDIAFRYLQPDVYKKIARHLQQRRPEREANIELIISELKQALQKHHIETTVYGRAKHIYSIYLKMQRKNVDIEKIYDAHAVRILVPNLKDCYTALSVAHNLWTPITEEFDDYINAPKKNGYQSIHTAVIGPNKKNFEIQIRTYQMHEDAEKGVAAHWLYKEGGKNQGGYEEKVAWLRQLLEWQKEVSKEESAPIDLEKKILEDRVYIFTPSGEIVDLPHGATPLDFAYNVHTEIGHRCRGAKVNGKIVPLTYELQTGERVEVLTTKISKPSRDWLTPQRGYLKTSRARAKVAHWFKQQDTSRHIDEGRAILEKELQRLNIEAINFDKIAHRISYKTSDAMLGALGNGDLRISHILHAIEKEYKKARPSKEDKTPSLTSNSGTDNGKGDISIYGVGDMLTQIAKCCKPIPGDPIIGYITQGHGVSIHHRDCKNIINKDSSDQNRIIEVEWRNKNRQIYPVDIKIHAYDRSGLMRDISNVLANEKIRVTRLNSHIHHTKHTVDFHLTIEIADLSELGQTLDRIQQLPNVYEVKRC